MNFERHHKSIGQYAADCAESNTPWKAWEEANSKDEGFTPLTCHPTFDKNYYRRVGFKLKSGVPYPCYKPLIDLIGTTVYVVFIGEFIDYKLDIHNYCDGDFKQWSAQGRIHLSEENAKSHSDILAKMSQKDE